MNMKEYEAIFDSDMSEADKLAQAFRLITDSIVTHAQNEIELLKAMNDKENLVKEQIKLNTVQHVQGIFRDAYLRATDKRSQDA